jgi:hypothetical protein
MVLVLENRKRVPASLWGHPTRMGRTLRDLAPFASELTPLCSRHEFTASVHERSKFERGTSDDDIL